MFSVIAKKTTLLLVASLFIVISHINAQPEPPTGGADGPGGPQSGAVPVDGGLALLLATGVGYGAKKAYDYRKNKVKSEK
jgi:hypothetical protein